MCIFWKSIFQKCFSKSILSKGVFFKTLPEPLAQMHNRPKFVCHKVLLPGLCIFRAFASLFPSQPTLKGLPARRKEISICIPPSKLNKIVAALTFSSEMSEFIRSQLEIGGWTSLQNRIITSQWRDSDETIQIELQRGNWISMFNYFLMKRFKFNIKRKLCFVNPPKIETLINMQKCQQFHQAYLEIWNSAHTRSNVIWNLKIWMGVLFCVQWTGIAILHLRPQIRDSASAPSFQFPSLAQCSAASLFLD